MYMWQHYSAAYARNGVLVIRRERKENGLLEVTAAGAKLLGGCGRPRFWKQLFWRPVYPYWSHLLHELVDTQTGNAYGHAIACGPSSRLGLAACLILRRLRVAVRGRKVMVSVLARCRLTEAVPLVLCFLGPSGLAGCASTTRCSRSVSAT